MNTLSSLWQAASFDFTIIWLHSLTSFQDMEQNQGPKDLPLVSPLGFSPCRGSERSQQLINNASWRDIGVWHSAGGPSHVVAAIPSQPLKRCGWKRRCWQVLAGRSVGVGLRVVGGGRGAALPRPAAPGATPNESANPAGSPRFLSDSAE